MKYLRYTFHIDEENKTSFVTNERGIVSASFSETVHIHKKYGEPIITVSIALDAPVDEVRAAIEEKVIGKLPEWAPKTIEEIHIYDDSTGIDEGTFIEYYMSTIIASYDHPIFDIIEELYHYEYNTYGKYIMSSKEHRYPKQNENDYANNFDAKELEIFDRLDAALEDFIKVYHSRLEPCNERWIRHEFEKGVKNTHRGYLRTRKAYRYGYFTKTTYVLYEFKCALERMSGKDE